MPGIPSRPVVNELLPHFSAWRVMRAGSREVVDAILAPSAQGPTPALAAALDRWPGKWYWLDDARTRLVLVRPLVDRRPNWLLHGALMLITVLCTLGAGAILAGGYVPHYGRGIAGVFTSAFQFFLSVAEGDWYYLLIGWSFAVPLLAILLIHELGHYFAARRYAIDTSPPYFLPVPPTFSPIGSLGAFIRLRSPVLDRRQLLDVGAAGPLAGFVVAVLVLIWGYSISDRIPIVVGSAPSYVTIAGQPIFLGESLLTAYMRDWLLPGTGAVHLSLPAFAGWVGVFITGLNLIPLSQFDGGHILYGMIGRRQSQVALLAVAALLFLAQTSPNWYVWVILAFVVGGGRLSHPEVLMAARPIPRSRWWIGLACLVVFALTFIPHPFR
jgi:hypothetical protein